VVEAGAVEGVQRPGARCELAEEEVLGAEPPHGREATHRALERPVRVQEPRPGDPDPRVSGRGFAQLRAAGIRAVLKPLPEAEALNEGFAKRLRDGRPLVRLKIAQSLDGRTAMASGESRWITGAAARADVQYWRARSCAVLTGSGTVLADDPQLNVREQRFAVDGRLRQPLRVVVDSGLQVPPDAALLRTEGPLLFVHGAAGAAPAQPPRDGVEHLRCGEAAVDLPALLRELAGRGCNEVLVEAGPRLVGAFLAAGLWDELLVYVAPKLLGSDARPMAQLGLASMAESVHGTIVDCTPVGEDLRLRLRPAPTGSVERPD